MSKLQEAIDLRRREINDEILAGLEERLREQALEDERKNKTAREHARKDEFYFGKCQEILQESGIRKLFMEANEEILNNTGVTSDFYYSASFSQIGNMERIIGKEYTWSAKLVGKKGKQGVILVAGAGVSDAYHEEDRLVAARKNHLLMRCYLAEPRTLKDRLFRKEIKFGIPAGRCLWQEQDSLDAEPIQPWKDTLLVARTFVEVLHERGLVDLPQCP